MRREQLVVDTRRLVAEGERLQAQPSLAALRTWLQVSDALLAAAWGSMDRYHLTWLMVGKPKSAPRGRAMSPDEEAAYVREVAAAKTAALRTSLDAVERQGMPFLGEEGGVGPGQGMGRVPTVVGGGEPERPPIPEAGSPSAAGLPSEAGDLQARVEEARRRAAEHEGHERRAPRPERLQR
ncbi:MAG TPA: hypothetical protein VF763_12675 [Candidatus Limnocylindrales bacterium]